MKNELTPDSLIRPIVGFVRRFHTILFFLVVSGGLFAAILMLLSIISLSSLPAATADNAVSGSFDEETIQQLESGTNGAVTPKGRASPFVE